MTTKKKGVAKPKNGKVAQSLRLTVAENKLLSKAAGLERMSVNTFALRTLIAAAKKTIAAHESTA